MARALQSESRAAMEDGATNVGDSCMSIFNRIEELLTNGESFALAVIVSRSGPAPRDVGTRMVVRADLSIVGTIGGGVLEAQVRGPCRGGPGRREINPEKILIHC